ncbi:MAG: DUF1697 domain-containing protein [Acidobacteriota bacterium]
MPRYIALLRAINVGGHVVKMDRLRELFESLELASVETFIASGNVIFDSRAGAAALEPKIEATLRTALGYEVRTFLRTAQELAAVAGYRPFPDAQLDTPGSSLYIAFLPAIPDEASRNKLLALRNDIDDLHLYGRELYWWCRGRMLDSTLTGARLEKTVGMAMTARNVTTVRKLAAKYCVRPSTASS